ncbi:peptidoglycan-associated lipoprotein Pal [Thermodesulfovibrio sp.]|uniref:peptidoglycan-associated lipoprotein Pal n=1 Tax=Thermodesulfovibrio sp. TaxID=2067987 RepID=UPI0030B5C4A2
MNFKSALISALMVALLLGCAERKIYFPKDTATSEQTKTNDMIQKEDKTAENKSSELSSQDIREQIRRIQEEVGDIYFDYDKYDIRQNDIPMLKKVASFLQKYPRVRVIIEGHCDERGTNEYNFALGQKRANAAKQYLITLGVPSSRIDIVSYGEEKPVCTEQNEACWQKNRRAHFVFIEEGK